MTQKKLYALKVSLPQWQRVMKERTIPEETIDDTVRKIMDELDEHRLSVIKQAEQEIISDRLEEIFDSGEL